MTDLRLRVLAGILLSLIWVTANVAFASAEPPSAQSTRFTTTTDGATVLLPTQSPTPSIPVMRTTGHTPPPTSSTRPFSLPTPTSKAAVSTTQALLPPTTIQIAPEHSVAPTGTSPTTITRASVPPRVDPPVGTSIVEQEYRYYDRGPHVVSLQEELGMNYIDGIYGPMTRRAHINALGGPHNAVIIFYPELFATLTPCSHGCLPGDGHYLLPTLGELINRYFLPEDRELAHKIAFCESSARSWHIGSEVVSHAFAIGWFQHLAKYWPERSEKAGWGEYHPFHAEANVAVAAWLYYSSGVHHWNPSKACWGQASL